jgi:hypothetical protein
VASDEWLVARLEIRREVSPPPCFFGSVDSRVVKAKNHGSVDSSGLEIVYNECDTKTPRFLGSVDSKGG